ncbi:MAG: glycosyltransferase family 2 protein [Dehalococcoidia bacterium]
MAEARVPELSVFFPAKDEEANVRATTEAILRVLPEVADRYEVLIVDDGSTDATPRMADELREANPNVHVIHHATNRGYGGALRTGFYNCRYDLISFIDGDGQFDFGQIRQFLPYVNQYDAVIGYRVQRQDTKMRSLNARAWGTLIRLVFGLQARDIDCAFKLINRRVLGRIPRLRSDGAMISAELLIRCRNAGIGIKEVPVQHYPRRGGEQTGATMKVIVKAFRDLFSLWRTLRR